MRAATITVRTKVRFTAADRPFVQLPELGRHHCDMDAFRRHPKYGSYANSQLFPAMLKRIRDSVGLAGRIYLDEIPARVTVTPQRLLHVITIAVPIEDQA